MVGAIGSSNSDRAWMAEADAERELEALRQAHEGSRLSPAEHVDLCISCLIGLGCSTRWVAQRLKVGKSRVSDIKYGRIVNHQIGRPPSYQPVAIEDFA